MDRISLLRAEAVDVNARINAAELGVLTACVDVAFRELSIKHRAEVVRETVCEDKDYRHSDKMRDWARHPKMAARVVELLDLRAQGVRFEADQEPHL